MKLCECHFITQNSYIIHSFTSIPKVEQYPHQATPPQSPPYEVPDLSPERASFFVIMERIP